MTESDFPPNWNGRRLAAFRRRLLRWYDEHGRDLPWRRTRDPYRVWISEIMLQQTTVAAVVPYFEWFLERFPSVAELAASDERDVLRLWEGLGYYSRARNMHRAAKLVANEHAGEFPQTVEELRKLPGVGRYTAAAIASFAFERPAGIVEANTLRLYCRLLGYDGDPRSAGGQKRLWDFAGRLVPRNSPGEFNHALMDLGATVCCTVEPACGDCPVRQHCRAFAEDRTAEVPRPAKRTEIVELTEAAVVVRKNGRVLLRRCQPGERWAGLWDFPRFELGSGARSARRAGKGRASQTGRPEGRAPTDAALQRTVESHVKRTTGIEAAVDSFLDEIRHGVTRYRIRLLCYTAAHQSGSLKRNAQLQWVPLGHLREFPLSATGRRIAEKLTSAAAISRPQSSPST